MLSTEEIAFMLNEFMLKELKSALNELEGCNSLAQARGGLHSRGEAFNISSNLLVFISDIKLNLKALAIF